MSLPQAILLMGPTASGKTALALEIAARWPVELISVDSAQVFRDMNIGTAKPDGNILRSFPHHLIDLISPEESYSAARFREDALQIMADCVQRDRVPLLVGGTMLYFKALMSGIADLPPANAMLRAEIDRDASERGWPALHADLARIDPPTAARLHPSDAQRIQRALEICRQAHRPMSQLLAESAIASPGYEFISLGLLPSDRLALHERIAHRFDAMLDAGLVNEVCRLRQIYRLHAALPSMRCVGYRQAWEALEGTLPMAELRDRGIFATRQLAKRQITWLTNSLSAECFDCLSPRLLSDVLSRLERHFG